MNDLERRILTSVIAAQLAPPLVRLGLSATDQAELVAWIVAGIPLAYHIVSVYLPRILARWFPPPETPANPMQPPQGAKSGLISAFLLLQHQLQQAPASTTTVTPDAFQALLALLKFDALQTFGTPLLTFLQADAEAETDPAKIAAAAFQLEGNLAPAVPQFLGELNTAVAQLAIAKIKAAQAAATPLITPPVTTA